MTRERQTTEVMAVVVAVAGDAPQVLAVADAAGVHDEGWPRSWRDHPSSSSRLISR